MINFDEIISPPISDETAHAIGEFLYSLAAAWEEQHFSQMSRYCHDDTPQVCDPEHPWL